MHIGGGAALGAARRRIRRTLRAPAANPDAPEAAPDTRGASSAAHVRGAFSSPRARIAFGLAVITPVVLAGAVGGSATSTPFRDAAVTPLAAVGATGDDWSGPSVVAVTKTAQSFSIAGSSAFAPPPAAVVNSPGAMRIPAMALSAYRNAERMMAAAYPGCGVSWNLLAGIGRIESMHAYGGATDSRGTPVRPIFGPALDGTLPGNEVVVQNRTAERVVYARAMGPMQFLPGTWSRYAADGDGDGKADVQNLFDSTLAAARYLCSGGMNLRDQSHVMSAILRYNNSVAYARNVLGWAAAYATGVVPMDLPPITGSVPALGSSTHVDTSGNLGGYEGLGPGLPINALGLPANDPMALMPLLERDAVASQIPGYGPRQRLGPLPGPAPQAPPRGPAEPEPWRPPWMPAPKPPECAVFCIQDQPAPLQPALPGPAPAAQPMVPAPAAQPMAPPPAPPPLAPPPPGPPPPPAPAAPAPFGPPAPGPPPGPVG